MGLDLHHSILSFFEDRMQEHFNVLEFRKIANDQEHIYEIRRVKFGPVKIWLSDQYSFGDMDFYNRPNEIRTGDYILIARPEASPHKGGYTKDGIRIGKIGDLMGALTKKDVSKYEPPSDEDKKKRR